jgi:vancomycin resistance protein YoaR
MGSFGRAPRPFKGRHGRVVVNLDPAERELLAGLLHDVAGLLDPEAETAATETAAETAGAGDEWAQLEAALAVAPPSDPAVARLLPDGNRDDPELAQSYRRLTEHGLRESKRAALVTAAAALRRDDPVVLDRDEATALLKGMNDVRLVVAERVGLRTDEDATALHLHLELAARRPENVQVPDAEQAWLGMAALYEALTWWQEALVAAVR